MNTNQDTGAIGTGAVRRSDPTGNIFAQIMKLPGAVGRLIAGPPMSDRDRFKQNVAEARGMGDWLRHR